MSNKNSFFFVNGDNELILGSKDPGSTEKWRLGADDDGNLTMTDCESGEVKPVGSGGSADLSAIAETTTTNEITWDGVVDGRVTVDVSGNGLTLYVHISDYVPDMAAFIESNGSYDIAIAGFGVMQTAPFEGEAVSAKSDDVYMEASTIFAIALSDGASCTTEDGNALVFPKKGIYSIYGASEGNAVYVARVTSPAIVIPVTKLKESALPDDIARTAATGKTYYVSLENRNTDPYFYNDLLLSKKVGMNEFFEAIQQGVIRIGFVVNGYVLFFCTPYTYGIGDGVGIISVTFNIESDPEEHVYRTAEYTPPTT